MTSLVKIAFVLLNGAMALFPARYRRDYGEERTFVLRLALEEAASGGWLRLFLFCAREWRDLPLALLREYRKEWRLRMEAVDNSLERTPEPAYALWAGLFPFMLLGLMALAYQIPNEWGISDFVYVLAGLLWFGSYLLICIGLLFGALAGFPAWALPYLVYAVVFALYTGDAGSLSLVVFNIEIWGALRSFVPLVIVIVLVARLNRDPWALVDKLLDGVSKDWSRLTFGLYGLLPLLVFISFDEMDNLYSFPGAMVGLILIMLGAFFYLRLKSPSWRTFSMVLFASLGILAVKATVHLYWDTHSVNLITGERHLLEGPVPYASILAKAVRDSIGTTLFLLLPAAGKLLGFIHQFGQSISKRLPRSG